MYTPPNPSSGNAPPLAFSPLASTSRRRGLPTRSSLSTSFSFAPAPDIIEEDSSFSFSYAHRPAYLANAVDQGNRGMGQVSPRVKPSPMSSSRTLIPQGSKLRPRLGDESPERTRRTSPRKRTEAEVNGEDEERNWDMVDSMRLWRHDAIMQHLYETAGFWGDKILTWTGTSPCHVLELMGLRRS